MSGQRKANSAIFISIFRQTMALILLGLVISGCTSVLSSANDSPAAATPAVVVAATPTVLAAATPTLPVTAPPAALVAATPTMPIEAPPTIPVETTPALPVEINPEVQALDQPGSSDDPPPPGEVQAAPNEATYSYGQAMVDSVEVLTLDASLRQVQVVARGKLPDSCTEIYEALVNQAGNTFQVNLTTRQRADRMCTQTLVPYEKMILLNVSGLPGGEYIVNVNGATSTFTFGGDDASREVALPSPLPDTKVTPDSSAGFSQIRVYLVALNDQGQNGQKIGCDDSLVAVERDITPTIAPLRAAINELLALKDQYYGQSGLYNALYQSDLQIEDIEITGDGTAIIHLVGASRLGGECDMPRFEAQLEQTARQFSTVNNVAVFINDTPLKEALSLAGTPPQFPAQNSNWTTFTAENYTIEYPPDLYAVQNGPATSALLPPGIIILEPTPAFNTKEPMAVTYRISLAVIENSQNLTLDNPSALFGRGPVIQYVPELLANHPVQEVSLGGLKAFKVNDISAGLSGLTADIVTLKDNKIYEIVVEPAQASGDPEVNKAVFETIISSFRFTN